MGVTVSNLLFLFHVFIYFWLYFLAFFCIAKILVKDTGFKLPETAYIVGASICCAAIRIMPTVIGLWLRISIMDIPPIFFTLLVTSSRILLILFLFIYICKLKSYSVRKTIILVIFTDLFAFVARHLTDLIFLNFTPYIRLWRHEHALWAVSNSLISVIFSSVIAFLVIKIAKKLRAEINASDTAQTALMLGALFCWLTYEIAAIIIVYMRSGISWVVYYYSVGYIGFSLISFFVYTRYLNAKLVIKQKEAEDNSLRFYLAEIEQQQTAIRKFKHDLQNLLSTLDIYVIDRDLDGLIQFYPKLRETSNLITKNEFELEGLSKIKVQEVKNILIAKLVVAQNLEINITLEIEKDINYIPVDSVSIVRILGIILDNAIEELQALGEGGLYIACFNIEDSINITVQNTCREDMPPIKQLQQPNFSTKGEGRGLGLSNLHELIQPLLNVSLMTSVEGGHFTQSLIIEGEVT